VKHQALPLSIVGRLPARVELSASDGADGQGRQNTVRSIDIIDSGVVRTQPSNDPQ
jgi:hypothetical protein